MRSTKAEREVLAAFADLLVPPTQCHTCGQTWARDPALEVACPVVACGAKVGQKCKEKHPSGHALSAAFISSKHFHDGVHDERDILAMQTVPGYGKCPKPPKGKTHVQP